MAKVQGQRSKGSRHGHGHGEYDDDGDRDGDDGGSGGEGNGGDDGEESDDPGIHKEIEAARFREGLPATPGMYARALAQWYRLPGSLVRSSMNPVVAEPADEESHQSGDASAMNKGGAR